MNVRLMCKFFLIMYCTIAAIACSDDDSAAAAPTPNTQQNEKVLQMVNGTIVKSERETEGGVPVTEVYVRTAVGSLVKVRCTETGGLVEVEGEEAPFSYEVTPAALMAFSRARNLALQVRAGTLLEWKLEKDAGDAVWQYRFELESNGAEVEIRMDAHTGNSIEIREND